MGGTMDKPEEVTVDGHTYPNQAAADRDKTTARWIKGCGFLAITAVIGLFVGCQMLLNAPDKPAEPSAFKAESACREAVQRQLKNPTSAEFADEKTMGSGPFVVTGMVAGTNQLGGMVTYNYICRADGITDAATAELSAR